MALPVTAGTYVSQRANKNLHDDYKLFDIFCEYNHVCFVIKERENLIHDCLKWMHDNNIYE